MSQRTLLPPHSSYPPVSLFVSQLANPGQYGIFLIRETFWRTNCAVGGRAPSNTVNLKRSLVQICLVGLLLLPAGRSGAQAVTQISAGFYHSLLLKTNGSLWATGWDFYGQLGNGAYHTSYPYGVNAAVQALSNKVSAISAGGEHSLLLKTNGSLWSMGWNAYGQLGDGTTDAGNFETNKPEQIIASNVVAISAGLNHSLFVEGDGSLWAMGDNSYGQLGDGSSNGGNYLTNRPEKIVTNNVKSVAAGYRHSLFLKNDGSLWGMGNNAYGQLGDTTWVTTNIPVEIVTTNVIAIAAGDQDSLFLESDGSLWGMGNNSAGQLGIAGVTATNIPTMLVASNVTAMSVGSSHVLFVKSDGSLWGMGNNHYGQLGNGSLVSTPISRLEILSGGVTAVSAGYGHSLFLKADGSMWGMGDNLTGQLGSGNDTSVSTPEQLVAHEFEEPHAGTEPIAAKPPQSKARRVAAGARVPGHCRRGPGESDHCHQRRIRHRSESGGDHSGAGQRSRHGTNQTGRPSGQRPAHGTVVINSNAARDHCPNCRAFSHFAAIAAQQQRRPDGKHQCLSASTRPTAAGPPSTTRTGPADFSPAVSGIFLNRPATRILKNGRNNGPRASRPRESPPTPTTSGSCSTPVLATDTTPPEATTTNQSSSRPQIH